MVEDFEVCRRPWGFEPRQVAVPVVLWHGLRDRLVPVRHALRLAGALPACATRLEPRTGRFFFGERVAEIVESVLGPLGAYSRRVAARSLSPCSGPIGSAGGSARSAHSSNAS